MTCSLIMANDDREAEFAFDLFSDIAPYVEKTSVT